MRRDGAILRAPSLVHNQGVSERAVQKEELQAAIEARKELGAEMEPAIIDAFVERIEQRLAERDVENERALKRKRDHQKEMVLGAMGISVPLFVVAAIFTGYPASSRCARRSP
jgi:hypothetical protein